MSNKRTQPRSEAQLSTTRQAGDRKRNLGQEPGKQFRGYGNKPHETADRDRSEFNLKYLNEIIDLKKFVSREPNAVPTAFENAVETYLYRVAIAQIKKRPLPGAPRLIKKRYKGDMLRTWQKIILRTELFKRMRREALKSLSHVAQ